MYNQIADIYLEIFPLNQAFLTFIPEYLGKPGAEVLDLGCGPGDYVDTLSRAGYHVMGIDSSSVMITQAQVQKQGTFKHLSFAKIDQLDNALTKGFDCAYCIGNSLSYLPKGDLQPFLKGVRSLLNESGYFVMQVVNWDRLRSMRASDFPVNAISDGRSFHRRYEWINAAEVIFHTEIRQGDEILGSWHAHLFPIYFEAIVEDLQAEGFSLTGKFGDYAKSPFDPQSSPATILVAHKDKDLDRK